MQGTYTEEILPVLSPGRHRTPRQGACFMEYASYLAGQRWSDHPSCTHPTLAALARLVNDVISDTGRARLTPLIPSVVGLVGNDARVPLVVSVLAASTAVPVASEGRQRALASGLLRCEALLREYDGVPVQRALTRIRASLDLTPGAEAWARAFQLEAAITKPRQLAPADEAILRTSVLGIAEACVRDVDERLEGLLESAIAETRELLQPPVVRMPQPRAHAAPQEATRASV